MVDDNTRRIADQALDQLMAELQAGRSEALRNYLAAQARFHRYSWNNVLLIAAQRPTATRVAGFHTWHELGRFVRRGEKGIRILAPVRVKATEHELSLKGEKERDPIRLAGFRTAYVFDVSQTDGRELPRFATTSGDPSSYMDKLKGLVVQEGIVLTYDQTIAPAQGVSSGGHIRLLPDMPAAEEFSTLVHELAHEMLHRRDRDRLPVVVRETQAEAVAYVVSRGIGLEPRSASADYIALYNGNRETLVESLATIQSAATRILNELLPEPQRTPFDQSPERANGEAPSPELDPAESSDSPNHLSTQNLPAPEAQTWDR